MHLADINTNLPEIEVEFSVNHVYANLSRREAYLLLQIYLPDTPGLIAHKLGEGLRCAKLCAMHPEARGNKRYRDCEWVA